MIQPRERSILFGFVNCNITFQNKQMFQGHFPDKSSLAIPLFSLPLHLT